MVAAFLSLNHRPSQSFIGVVFSLNLKTTKFYTTPVRPAVGDDFALPEDEEQSAAGTLAEIDTQPTQGEFFGSDSNFATSRFEDGSFISLEEDFILISVNEENVPSLRENFDIEVFLEETDPNTGQEVLTQLFFEKKCKLVDDNNILLDQEDLEPAEFKPTDSDLVNHFFHVYVDEEIDKEELCRLVPAKERESSFPSEFLDCEDVTLPDGVLVDELSDLYSSNVTDDDIEDC